MIGVIFDMDGTLLDTQKIYIPAFEYAGKRQFVENVGSIIPDVCGMNEANANKIILSNFPTLDIVKFRKDCYGYIEKNLTVKYKKGAKELLELLKQKGIKMAVASGTRTKNVLYRLGVVDAVPYFDVILGGDSVENCKPSPDIFLLAAEKLGIPPENCYVFEDSENGVEAGYKANMKVIGIEDVVPFSEKYKNMMFCEHKSFIESLELFSVSGLPELDEASAAVAPLL